MIEHDDSGSELSLADLTERQARLTATWWRVDAEQALFAAGGSVEALAVKFIACYPDRRDDVVRWLANLADHVRAVSGKIEFAKRR